MPDFSTRRIAAALSVAVVLCWTPAWGWWSAGHALLTQAAVRALPGELPAFFRQGEEAAAHLAQDADLFKNRAMAHLNDAERGEHYINLERLEGRPLPATRYAFFDTCAALGLNPSRVGLLPYAVAEWTERLAIAFAEHRRWPDDLIIRQKCLVYAGMLAHYAQDACQPLHVTVDYNGRRQPGGRVVGRGIHRQMDALIEEAGFAVEELAQEQRVRHFGKLMPAIEEQIRESWELVDQTYALQGKLGDPRRPEVRAFALERARASVHFTASLYLTAWRMSAAVKLPSWHQR